MTYKINASVVPGSYLEQLIKYIILIESREDHRDVYVEYRDKKIKIKQKGKIIYEEDICSL
jgi:hypothetical protein